MLQSTQQWRRKVDKRILEMCREIDAAKLATAQEGVTAWAEKLLEDAERYQWMRERHENTIMDIYNSISPAIISPELFDAAIDSAMKENT